MSLCNLRHRAPARPHDRLVHRPRLHYRLDQSLQSARLTVLAAPSGYGKTTLVSSWLPTRYQPAAWFNLSETENDLACFFSGLIGGLQTITPTVGQTVTTILTSGQPPRPDVLISVLLNDLQNSVTTGILVLDGYSAITAPEVHTALSDLVSELPPTLHILLLTRDNSPLDLADLVQTGAADELTADDLRFTPDEAREYLTGTLGLALPPAALDGLIEHTDGWPGFLYLAGLVIDQLKHAGPTAAQDYIANFADEQRFTPAHLLDEVLRFQPPDIGALLVETTIVDCFTPELAGAITHLDDTSALIDHCQQAGLFIRSLVPEHQQFGLHGLWREMLHARLQDVAPERMKRLHQRAAAWYQHQGEIEASVTHLLAAGQWNAAAESIAQLAAKLLRQGRIATLLNWLRRMPDAGLRTSPLLEAYYAWVLLLDGQNEAATSQLTTAEKGDPTPAVRGILNAIRAHMAVRSNDGARAVRYASAALDVLPDELLVWRCQAAFDHGAGHLLENNLFAAGQALSTAVQLSLIAESTPTALQALNTLAAVQHSQGNLRWSAQSYRRALNHMAKTNAQHLPLATSPYVGLAELHYEWNDLVVANTYLQAGLERALITNSLSALVVGYYQQARINLAQGMNEPAQFALDTARYYARQQGSNHSLSHWLTTMQLRILISRGNRAAVADWLDATTLTIEDEISAASEYEYLMLARVLIFMEQAASAKLLLDRLLPGARSGHRTGRVIEGLALQALAHAALHELEPALSALRDALGLAAPELYVRTFVDEGPMMRSLLLRLNDNPDHGAYVRRLLSVFSVMD